VAQIDNRGTSGRGKAFKDAVYSKLGVVDIQDQADGVRSFFLPQEELLYCIRNDKAYTFINKTEDGIPVVLRYRMDWR
jgi:hypothetical protein